MLTTSDLFLSINSYFDHIYILTIPRAVERHKKIENDLKGLKFSFFYGVDKQNLNVAELEHKDIYNSSKAKQNSRYNKEMTKGEIACSMGHKMILKDIIGNNFSKALILEDDVIVNPEGVLLFEKIIKELPTNWDILYFDYHKNISKGWKQIVKQAIYHIQRFLGLLKFSHCSIKNLYATPYSQHLKKAGYHDYASAYAVTLKAAKKLVELQTPISYPADHVLPYAITNEILTSYITIPKIFQQLSQTNKEIIGSYVEQ